MPNVEKVQAGYKAQPLSAYPQAARAAGRAGDRLSRRSTKEIVKTNFFEYLDFALQFAPAGAGGEGRSAPSWRSIGIGPGKTFDFKDLSLEHKAEVVLGHEGGRRRRSTSAVGQRREEVNGWSVGSFFGDRAFYNGDWLLRAAGAKAGIYGNDAVEATYPLTKHARGRRAARRQQAQLHAHLPRRAVPAGERVLVGDDV